MEVSEIEIMIPLVNGGTVNLLINSSSAHALYLINENEAIENGESPYQIKEGYSYDFQIDNGYSLSDENQIVSIHKYNKSIGTISPNIYVGTLTLAVVDLETKLNCGEVKLEVQSVKTTYREDYRHMLEEITEKCTDLLLQHNSPVSHYFTINFNADAKTLYQRFAFIKSILDSEEFNDSIYKILSSPVTNWKGSDSITNTRNARRFNNSSMRQLCRSGNRIELPYNHPLKTTLKSIPSRIIVSYKEESVDTPENRFIKHALLSFQTFCSDIKNKIKDSNRLYSEAKMLEDKLEQILSHSFFEEITLPTTLPLNSPVLQRKEGYREIFRIWLMFDLAAKLIWHGGEDVYSGSKRDIAVLYEYWLFFKLLELISEIFKVDVESTNNLIEYTNDGLGLKLKQGKYLPIKGVYLSDIRKLNIEFSYNKTFKGDNKYPLGGSWSRNLRPDYTLSIWPFDIEQNQAEIEELIVHIHFDAKYKIENVQTIFGKEESLDEEKEDQKKGTYKRADLLKMHTYRDAIRRSSGAYILYPGSVSEQMIGFHEIIPGLGAFAISPSKYHYGTDELKTFLIEVVNHFMNRASQREKISLKTFETFKDNNINEVKELLPEAYGINRNLLPDETFVLVAFYKDENHLKWILDKRLYNARTGPLRGSLHLSSKEIDAKYILLHTIGEIKTSKLFKLKNKGPRIFSKADMIAKCYKNPSQDFYLVFEIDGEPENEFKNMRWDISKLNEYSSKRNSAIPFSVSLSKIMKVVIK